MSYPYPRTPYFFDLSGVRCKSVGDINKMRASWNTFERVENYDDQIYHRFTQGYFNQPYYQFRDRNERNEYNTGQALHIQRYPWVPFSDFNSIRNRPMPNVSTIVGPSEFIQVDKCIIPPKPITQEEQTMIQSDLAVYGYISTYNQAHVYKYQFRDNEEKLAYHRASERICNSQT